MNTIPVPETDSAVDYKTIEVRTVLTVEVFQIVLFSLTDELGVVSGQEWII